MNRSCGGLFVAACAVVALGCGRSSLLIGDPLGDAEADAGVGGSAGTGGTGGTAGTGGEPPAPKMCTLAEIWEPREIFDDPEYDAHTPSFAVTDVGDGDYGRQASAILQAVTDGPGGAPNTITAVPLFFDPVMYPGGMGMFQSPSAVVESTWSYAQMVLSHDSGAQVGLAWNAASQGIQFRTLDQWAWQPSPITPVWPTNATPLNMAGGPGAAPIGGYGGRGYGMVWDELPPQHQLVAAVLGEDGSVWLGPHGILGDEPADATKPAITWSGEAYLIATSVQACGTPDPRCRPQSLVISRVRPATGDLWDDSGIDLAGSFGDGGQNVRRGRPSIASWQGHTAVAWAERPGPNPGPRTVRIATLNPDGTPAGAPRDVATDARPVSGLRLSASRLGLVVLWVEEGDPALADDAPGRHLVIGHQLDFDLQPLGAPFAVGATLFSSWGFPPAAGIEYPDALVLTWSARSRNHTRNAAFVSRVECEQP